MIEPMVGRLPNGEPAVLPDYELIVQSGDQIPESVRANLSKQWSEEELANFQTYAIRPKEGAQVEGTLWELTPEERALVDNWEINDGLWYQKTDVAVNVGGRLVAASTEIIDDQTLPLATEINPELPVFLNSAKRMIEVARSVRENYLRDAS